MSFVTIFTAPKPFTNPHVAVIQRNAIMNWKALGPEVEIFLVGDEEGVAEAATEFGVGFIGNVERNASGTPRIDSIFNLVRQASRSPVMAYINADILLLPDFLKTIEMVKAAKEHFLIVGQRWDLDITEPMNFAPGWDEKLMEVKNQKGSLHDPVGSDFFIFQHGDFNNIPPFAVGRAGWDNWMIYAGRKEHMAVIDASQAITVIHQNHDYSHLAGGNTHHRHPESYINMKLMGGWYAVYSLFDVNYMIEGVNFTRPELTRRKILREIVIFPAITLKCKFLAKIFYFLYDPRKALRRMRKDRAMEMELK